MPEAGHTRELELVNKYGLHMRPATEFVNEANRYRCSVYVSVNGGEEGNGKSIIDLVARAVEKGAVIRVRTVGEDAEEALEALARLVASGFGEQTKS